MAASSLADHHYPGANVDTDIIDDYDYEILHTDCKASIIGVIQKVCPSWRGEDESLKNKRK